MHHNGQCANTNKSAPPLVPHKWCCHVRVSRRTHTLAKVEKIKPKTDFTFGWDGALEFDLVYRVIVG
jgi:hypothetical protein